MREMHGQLLADFFDTANKSAREIAILEFLRNDSRDTVPEFLPYLFVNAAIAQHDKLSARRHDEQKNTIAFPGVSHAHADKGLVRSLLDAAPEERRHGYADLTRRA